MCYISQHIFAIKRYVHEWSSNANPVFSTHSVHSKRCLDKRLDQSGSLLRISIHGCHILKILKFYRCQATVFYWSGKKSRVPIDRISKFYGCQASTCAYLGVKSIQSGLYATPNVFPLMLYKSLSNLWSLFHGSVCLCCEHVSTHKYEMNIRWRKLSFLNLSFPWRF